MLVQTDVRAHAEHVRTLHDIDVVDELRCGYGAECARRVDVWQRRIGEAVGNHVRPGWIRFALSEQKNEAREARGQFVHYARREYVAVGDGEIFGGSEHFAKRREAWKHFRPSIQRIAHERVVTALQPAPKQIVILIERVIDAIHVVRAAEMRGRIPFVGGRV